MNLSSLQMTQVIRRYRKWLSALCSETRGNIAVTTALMLPVLVGSTGLSLDTANWYTNHRQMDRIVETAAAAAASYLPAIRPRRSLPSQGTWPLSTGFRQAAETHSQSL
jgi:Putative Flp pilus-assembly TadE/G-like